LSHDEIISPAANLGRFPRLTFIAGQFSENLQGWSVISVTVRLYHDPHILIERHQEAKQAFHGKLADERIVKI